MQHTNIGLLNMKVAGGRRQRIVEAAATDIDLVVGAHLH
jgi:hypothetical protein